MKKNAMTLSGFRRMVRTRTILFLAVLGISLMGCGFTPASEKQTVPEAESVSEAPGDTPVEMPQGTEADHKTQEGRTAAGSSTAGEAEPAVIPGADMQGEHTTAAGSTAGEAEPAASGKMVTADDTDTSNTADTSNAVDAAREAAAALAADTTEKKEDTAGRETEHLIREYLKEMSLEDKVSGLFILTPEALTGYSAVTEAGEVTKEALEKWPVAGLIYFSGNIQDRDQTVQMLKNTAEWGGVDLKLADSGKNPEAGISDEPEAADRVVAGGTAAGEKAAADRVVAGGTAAGEKAAAEGEVTEYIHIPPFLAVDEEGGPVARVADSPIEVPYVDSMGTIGASGDPEKAFEAGSTIGEYLSGLGFNLDFAPDADVLIDPGNQTIGERSFGTDAALCGQMVRRYIDGLHANGIASCIKHFPGLGDTETDTHTGGAWSSRSLEDYRGAEFVSFRGGIEAGTDMVMISHLSNTELTGSDVPCSMNKTVITDILRGELGYEGVIITDSLQMGAVTELYDSAEAAVTALEAGADILLIPSDFRTAHQGILDAVKSGRISEERIDESLVRILTARAGRAAE